MTAGLCALASVGVIMKRPTMPHSGSRYAPEPVRLDRLWLRETFQPRIIAKLNTTLGYKAVPDSTVGLAPLPIYPCAGRYARRKRSQGPCMTARSDRYVARLRTAGGKMIVSRMSAEQIAALDALRLPDESRSACINRLVWIMSHPRLTPFRQVRMPQPASALTYSHVRMQAIWNVAVNCTVSTLTSGSPYMWRFYGMGNRISPAPFRRCSSG